jgi:hypothetical protein
MSASTQDITCNVCGEAFSDEVKLLQPLLLTCGHSFCGGCCGKLIKEKTIKYVLLLLIIGYVLLSSDDFIILFFIVKTHSGVQCVVPLLFVSSQLVAHINASKTSTTTSSACP